MTEKDWEYSEVAVHVALSRTWNINPEDLPAASKVMRSGINKIVWYTAQRALLSHMFQKLQVRVPTHRQEELDALVNALEREVL